MRSKYLKLNNIWDGRDLITSERIEKNHKFK